MSNKKITDLTELTNPTNDDVFPIVDIATNTTQKVQVGNLPIQTAVTTALATKQDTLVSGTNIKTINGVTVLGSGDIVTPFTPPSGVSGAIQFSNGSAFASDAANLFWDDTNNRLGIGTNSPSATAHFKGSGSTSATTSLLVQNSAGTAALTIKDDGEAAVGGLTFKSSAIGGNPYISGILYGPSFYIQPSGAANFGASTPANASAQLELTSTTKGFLPPRMTTTQRNAIASIPTGLVLYNTTTNKLQCYNGSTWNDLF
jgi:hypothetical protein